MTRPKKPIIFAFLAAVLVAVSTPVSKILLNGISPVMLASMLYLGAGAGMFAVRLFFRKDGRRAGREARLAKSDLPFVTGMVVLDIAAPIFLLTGLSMTTAQNASLLSNVEIAATSCLAALLFKEHIGRKLWIAIGLITTAGVLLSVTDAGGFHFSFGSLLVLLACACWGLENNCTRMLSIKDPAEIVVIKGLGSGLGSLLIAIALREQSAEFLYAVSALILGFFSYGLSIYFYVRAQRDLGAARTSAYYAAAPFFGVALSFVLFREKPGVFFFLALLIMAAGTALVIRDRHSHSHKHLPITHTHLHSHNEIHHRHDHPDAGSAAGEHAHAHTHEETIHRHEHGEDLHHVHRHDR